MDREFWPARSFQRRSDNRKAGLHARYAAGILFLIFLAWAGVQAFPGTAKPLFTIGPLYTVWNIASPLNHDDWMPSNQEAAPWAQVDFWAYISIDGVQKRFMGVASHLQTKIDQKLCRVNATQTIYTFSDAKVQLTVTFTAPMLLDELEALARPINYVTFDVKSIDGANHIVTIGFYTAQGNATPGWPRTPGWTINSATDMSKVVDFGTVGTTTVCKHLSVGHDQTPVMWFGSPLRNWWNRSGTKSFDQAFADADSDYDRLYTKCKQFDARLRADATAAADSFYADLCSVAYRQCLEDNQVSAYNDTTPFYFNRENSSGDLTNTIDVIFPQCPLLLYYNPAILKYQLNSIFTAMELKLGDCANGNVDHPPHDMGGPYPKVTGCGMGYHVEETGNMLIMTAAIVHLEKNGDYAKKHWPMLGQWTNWLVKNGLDPAGQNSTDDFTGGYAHSVGLATKALLGIGAYIKMAKVLGYTDSAAKYQSVLDTAVGNVLTRCYSSDKQHLKLASDMNDTTWGQKYNLVWNVSLGLKVFADSVRTKEVAWYLKRLHHCGIPLECRFDYAKSDWLLWTAALSGKQDDFRTIARSEWNYINEDTHPFGFADLHMTSECTSAMFVGRGVVGGFFMKLCADKCQGGLPVFNEFNASPTHCSRSGQERITVLRDKSGTVIINLPTGIRSVMLIDGTGRIVKDLAATKDRMRRQLRLGCLPAGVYTAIVNDGRTDGVIRICSTR